MPGAVVEARGSYRFSELAVQTTGVPAARPTCHWFRESGKAPGASRGMAPLHCPCHGGRRHPYVFPETVPGVSAIAYSLQHLPSLPGKPHVAFRSGGCCGSVSVLAVLSRSRAHRGGLPGGISAGRNGRPALGVLHPHRCCRSFPQFPMAATRRIRQIAGTSRRGVVRIPGGFPCQKPRGNRGVP